MISVGFDSAPIKKTTILPNGSGKGEFVANLGVSVTTHDKDRFESSYEDAISEALKKFNIERRKRIYKGAHLVAQAMEKAPSIMIDMIDRLEDDIAHIDVYCAYYSLEYISIYGQAEGQKLSPPAFVKKTQGAFPHVCSWWYVLKYAKMESPVCLEIDYFQTATTPAWRNLVDVAKKDVTVEFYFGGDECNPIISTADIILKLIRIYHHGTVEGRSLLQPLLEKCTSLEGKRKTWFHNMGSRGFLIKATAPDLPLQADTKPFIKHPILFYSWDVKEARRKDDIRSSFEWSPAYNAIVAQASLKKGGVKSFSFAEDPLLWKPETDIIIPITKEDLEKIKKLSDFGYKLPKIADMNSLIQTIKY
ncbi:MAG: hypothetical protein QXJ02_03240 [Candidatus Bathyarchaeia archaeon]